MNQIDLIAMFTLGFLGSGHCIGMCGPLVVALPGQTGKISNHFLYHTGRLITYSLVGGFMGGLGTGLVTFGMLFNFTPAELLKDIQLIFSAIAAAALLIFGLAMLGISAGSGVASLPEKIPGYKRFVGKVIVNPTGKGIFIAGLMLGLLPCGMSFAAFARALAAGSFIKGVLCLAFFGAGTFPALFLVGSGGTALFVKFRRQCNFVAGVMMVMISVKIGVKAYGKIAAAFL